MSKKICFIVGHGKSKNGGYDSGAVSGDFHEFKIAREIAKHAVLFYNKNYSERAELMNYDGDLYLTERIKAVNKADYDFIAEIHLNAGKGTGTECFYYHNSPTGKKHADQICKQISSDLGVEQRSNATDDGGDKIRLGKNGKDYFAIIRDTKPCAVLVETVFIDTEDDLAKVKTEEGQRKCGEAIAKAVAKVRGLQAITNTTTTEKPVKQPTKAENGTFKVKVIHSCLNIRKGAGTLHKKTGQITDNGVYTIVETNKAGTWGKLKSGAGWICIKPAYVKKM
ncbi:MAG: N-acetylmuramoyl-L-alanine amidase [Bacteroidales bacterium]|nr:N-acetylmuramoyl-L-alanine amidase [Bacteroidales bacterium]